MRMSRDLDISMDGIDSCIKFSEADLMYMSICASCGTQHGIRVLKMPQLRCTMLSQKMFYHWAAR